MSFNLRLTKDNFGIIKIPTLIGLAVLLIGLGGGVYLVTQNQVLKARATVTSMPKDLTIFNLSASSVALFWQTSEATTGFVQIETPLRQKLTYRDDRDPDAPEPHKLHFVTLTNLNPATTYSYQIYSGSTSYPNAPATFTTLSPVEALNWNPIVGTILDSKNQPVKEALITLELENAQSLSTITKAGGNFILPLSNLRTVDLNKSFPENKTPLKAKLKIKGPFDNTQAIIYVPSQDLSLPPIILGKDIDLTQNSASLSAEIQKFDLNGDKVINAVDLSIILKNFGKFENVPSISEEKKKADLNGDKIIDQKDVDLILPHLT